MSAQVLSNDKDIADLCAVVAGGVHYRGRCATHVLSGDGDTTKTITTSAGEITAIQGDMIIQPSDVSGRPDEEYIFDGTKWSKLGDASELKELAYHSNVSATYTPEGGVTVQNALTGALLVNVTSTSFTGSEFTSTFALAGTTNKITPTFTGALSTITPTWKSATAQSILSPTFTPATTTLSNVTAVKVPELEQTKMTLSVNASEVDSGARLTFTGTSTPVTFTNTGDITLANTAFTTTPTNLTDGSFTGAPGSVNCTGTIASTAFKFNSFNTVTEVTAATASVLNGASYADEVLTFNFATALTSMTPTKADIVPAINADITAETSGTFTPAGTIGGTYDKLTQVVVPGASVSGVLRGTCTPLGTIGGSYDVYTYSYGNQFNTAASLTTSQVTCLSGGTVEVAGNMLTSIDNITYTPAGTISEVDATPSGNVTVKFTPSGDVALTATVNASHTHTAEFAGSQATITGNPA